MDNEFTVEEKRKWMLKHHLKNHIFEYILDIVIQLIFTYILLRLCKAEYILLGLLLSFAYSAGRIISQIRHYQKEYVDIDIK